MVGKCYGRSPTNGEHWLVEAGELEANSGIYFARRWNPEIAEPGKYYSGFALTLENAGPALKAAYPQMGFELGQHGSHFYVWRNT